MVKGRFLLVTLESLRLIGKGGYVLMVTKDRGISLIFCISIVVAGTG